MAQARPFQNPMTRPSPQRVGNVSPKAQYQQMVRDAAAKYRIPEALLSAVIQVESGWNPKAVSPKGAQGLMQLMPATAQAYGVTDPLDPQQNIFAGAQHLSTLLTKYGGNSVLALAAYNAGEGAVDKVQGVPNFPETVAYVKKVGDVINAPERPQPTSANLPGNPMTRPRPAVPAPSTPVDRFPTTASMGVPGGNAVVPGLGQISNKAMEDMLDQIAQENVGAQDVDMSRQFTELQPGPYGSFAGGGAMGGESSIASAFDRPDEYKSISGGPSVANFYSGGSFPQPSGGLGWLSRLFGGTYKGGRTFGDESGVSER